MKHNTFYVFCASAILALGCAPVDDGSEVTAHAVSQALTDDASRGNLDEKPAPDAAPLALPGGPVPTCAVLAEGAECTKWGEAGKCHSGECCTGCVNPVTGQCNYGIQPSACGNGGDACKNCDDGRACNTDKCIDYTCVHTSLCDDGDDCTADRCKSTGCEYYPEINGTTCNGVGTCLGTICQMPAQDEPDTLVRAPDSAAETDALPITCAILAEGAHCTEGGEQGMCVSGGCCTWCPVWDGCDDPCDASDADTDQCGIGWCSPSGCCVMPQANAIADVDQHDADAMSSCRLFPEVCDDGNDCTNDVCTDTGCRNYFQSIGASCDNGDGVCSVAGICCHGCASAFSSAKAIKPCHLFPDACDDGNDCTDDICTDYGCAHPASDDGSYCGLFDICRHGTCVDRCGTIADCPQPAPGNVPACIDSACVEVAY